MENELTVTMPSALMADAKVAAVCKGMSLDDFILEAISEKLRNLHLKTIGETPREFDAAI